MKLISLERLSYFFEKCKATFALITHTHDISEIGADESYSPIKESDITTKKYVDDNIQNIKDAITPPFTEIIFKDSINGYNYTARMENGQIISYCSDVVGISIETMPNKVDYVEGDAFDPTGMVVVAICADGSAREIENYTYPDTVTESTIMITYEDYSVELQITIISLIDFEYTTNDDGTYTITGWKETLNGEPSTILSVPNSDKIIV